MRKPTLRMAQGAGFGKTGTVGLNSLCAEGKIIATPTWAVNSRALGAWVPSREDGSVAGTGGWRSHLDRQEVSLVQGAGLALGASHGWRHVMVIPVAGTAGCYIRRLGCGRILPEANSPAPDVGSGAGRSRRAPSGRWQAAGWVPAAGHPKALPRAGEGRGSGGRPASAAGASPPQRRSAGALPGLRAPRPGPQVRPILGAGSPGTCPTQR